MSEDEGSSEEFRRLLEQAATDKDDARDQLIELATRRLHTLTKMMFRDFARLRRWEETDDIYQQAVVRLLKSLDDVKPESRRDFYGLAMTQIRRTLIDLARRYFGPEGQAANHYSDTGSRLKVDAVSDVTTPPETEAGWAAFHEAVDSLPGEEREAFSTCWYGGMNQTDAADLLGISRRTMTRRMTRARLLLRDHMVAAWPADIGEQSE